MNNRFPCLVRQADIPDCCHECGEIEADEDMFGNATGDYYCLLNVMIPIKKQECRRQTRASEKVGNNE